MQDQLDKAIYDWIDGDATLKGLLSDKWFADSAPQNTEFPYLVWNWILIPHAETFTSRIEDASLQLSIFSKNQSVNEVNAIADALFARFDNAKIVVADYYTIRCRRVSSRRLKDPEDAWMYYAEYLLSVQEI